MIELVFSASPETVRKGASGVCLHRSIGRRQDLAVCALCDLDSFLLSLRFLCRGAAELSYWHEVSLLAVHCEQIGQEFACHRECGAIGIPFLFLPGVEQGEIRIVSRSQLRRLHQHMLNMFVALLGKRCAHCLVGGFLFVAAKPAVADGLANRWEARNIPHLQRPRQCCDLAHGRYCLQAPHSLRRQSASCWHRSGRSSSWMRRSRVA